MTLDNLSVGDHVHGGGNRGRVLIRIGASLDQDSELADPLMLIVPGDTSLTNGALYRLVIRSLVTATIKRHCLPRTNRIHRRRGTINLSALPGRGNIDINTMDEILSTHLISPEALRADDFERCLKCGAKLSYYKAPVSQHV